MAKIVVIGNSSSGFSCCETLVKSGRNDAITVISEEKTVAYRKDLLVQYLEGTVKEKELFLCEDDFYAKNGITLLKDSRVVSVDTRKKRIVLKDSTKVPYEYAVIASGRRSIVPDIPGKTKEGVFVLYSLEDIRLIRKYCSCSDMVCVVGDPVLCARIGGILRLKGKDVKIISAPRPESFIPEEKIEWIDEFNLSEIIGDGALLKAVKLNNGKVIGSGMVLFAGNSFAPCDFTGDAEFEKDGDYILVDDSFRTNIEDIFACGAVCRKKSGCTGSDKTWSEASAEGQTAAGSILEVLNSKIS